MKIIPKKNYIIKSVEDLDKPVIIPESDLLKLQGKQEKESLMKKVTGGIISLIGVYGLTKLSLPIIEKLHEIGIEKAIQSDSDPSYGIILPAVVYGLIAILASKGFYEVGKMVYDPLKNHIINGLNKYDNLERIAKKS